MTTNLADAFLADIADEFRRHKSLADQAMASLDDAAFFHRPAPVVNSVAAIVKHLAGNLRSRWTDVLTTDGEKPNRHRDQEFVIAESDSRAALLASWEQGWQVLFDAISTLKGTDLQKAITIRGQALTVAQGLIRGLAHAAYHTGQIMYLSRMGNADAPWLTMPLAKQ